MAVMLFREKFCDSMESLNSIESATNGAEKGSAMKSNSL